MIKKLIEDIAYDTISLNQALTRAKLIARKIKNEAFSKWVDSEMNGYNQSNDLPDYRNVDAEPIGDFISMRGALQNAPLMLDPEQFSSLFKVNIYNAIHELEGFANRDKGNYLSIKYTPEQVRLIGTLFAEVNPGWQMNGGGYRVTVSDFKNIIQQTKNRLLDTLLELNDAFPNLENEFQNNTENSKVVSQIITNNIYGNNASTSVGIGNNNSITSQVNQIDNRVESIFQQLTESGVDQESLADLRERVKEKEQPKRYKKIMDWMGAVTGKMIEKGLEAKLPQIMAQVSELATALGG